MAVLGNAGAAAEISGDALRIIAKLGCARNDGDGLDQLLEAAGAAQDLEGKLRNTVAEFGKG
jgi:hypothetical protein